MMFHSYVNVYQSVPIITYEKFVPILMFTFPFLVDNNSCMMMG